MCINLICPACGEYKFSVWEKARLAPLKRYSCKKCGADIRPGWFSFSVSLLLGQAAMMFAGLAALVSIDGLSGLWMPVALLAAGSLMPVPAWLWLHSRFVSLRVKKHD
jgi:hypothetical protein